MVRTFFREFWNKPAARKLVSNLFFAVGLLIFIYFAVDYIQESYPPSKILDSIKILVLAIIPGVIVSLINTYRTKEQIVANLANQVEDSIRGTLGAGSELGLVRCHRTFDFVELFNNLSRGDELLWLDTYCPAHNEFIDALGKALERGVRIKMLIIDPECSNTEYRAEEIGGSRVR